MTLPQLSPSWGAFALLVGFAAIQHLSYGQNHVNPPAAAEPEWDSPDTRALAQEACFDCHSNQTRWPAHSHIAPTSWLVEHDVDEGRSVLNFSEWRPVQADAAEAAEKVLEGTMPPLAYRAMHPPARLSEVERDRLARGLAHTLGAPDGSTPAGPAKRNSILSRR
jgi:hypothetical protein